MWGCVHICVGLLSEKERGRVVFVYEDRVGFSGFHGTCSVNQAGLEFRDLHVSSCSARIKGVFTIPG